MAILACAFDVHLSWQYASLQAMRTKLLESIDDELVRRIAIHSEKAIAEGQPIEPLEVEMQQNLEQREQVIEYRNSPTRQTTHQHYQSPEASMSDDVLQFMDEEMTQQN